MVRRALVVDDDQKARELVRAILEDQGWEVQEAADGVAALNLADANPPDVVILDVMMPGLDGYEVCRVLRQGPHTHQLPVVMLTASGDTALNRKAYEAGAQACVPKPFSREVLMAAIEAALLPKRQKPG
jgi:DNA-binding response OmpR family regulator